MSARIETQQLVHFLTVAETGSFRKAANRLGLGQSAVSRRIQRLEDLLGVSLFERRSTGARLTPAGSGFASRARAIVDDLETAAEIAKTAGVAGNGHVRIGIIASLSKGPLRTIVERYLAENGDVDVCFVESDRGELLTLLSHRRIDAVYAAGESASHTGDGLVVAMEETYLAVTSNSPFAGRERLAWRDVANAQFVVSAREPGPEIHDYIIRHVSDLGRRARVHRHRLGREGIMNLVGLGLGVSLVADHWRGVSYPNVVFVPIGDSDKHVPFSLTWRPENDNPALRRFVSQARIVARETSASNR